jgi:hypothetical protein
MAELQFERSGFDSGRLGRRLLLCIGLSIVLHALLVIGMKYQPLTVNFEVPKALFAFDATLRQTLRQVEDIVTPAQRLNENARSSGKEHAQPRRPADAQPDAFVPANKPLPADNAVPRGSEQPAARIDFDEARRIAREFGHRDVDPRFDADAGAAIALETETPAQQALAKAARPDCRTEYAGGGHVLQGLLALPLLIRDTVTNTGCKW